MKFVIEHLSKSFEKKEVLRDIDFTFDEGKIYGLLGRNGAGKTTLFNCLNRDLKADSGNFYIEDENGVRREIAAEDIGYVLSTPTVPEFLTGREFLKFFMDINEKSIKNPKSIDEYFDYCFGHLEYRSLHFEHKRINNIENYQGNAVVNYCEREIPYTRLIEHKHFEYGTQPFTVITYEYPTSFELGKEPYYPINDSKNNSLFRKYQMLAMRQDKVLFGGRLAQYMYADMDDTIVAALELWKNGR